MAWYSLTRDEKKALIRKCVAKGMTTAQIATHVRDGVTRNVIIGFAHRAKVPLLGKTMAQKSSTSAKTNKDAKPDKRSSAGKKRAKPKAPEKKPDVVATDDLSPAEPVTQVPEWQEDIQPLTVPVDTKVHLLNAMDGLCRAPLWPTKGNVLPSDMFYCGKPTKEGKAFCEEHAAQFYVEPVSLKRRRR